jgi:hypothetical protein
MIMLGVLLGQLAVESLDLPGLGINELQQLLILILQIAHFRFVTHG